jgi:hypothetical protein
MTRLRRVLAASAAAWLVLAAVVLSRFADEPLPATFLPRPLLVAIPIAVAIGLASQLAGRHAVAVAAMGALVFALAQPMIVVSSCLVLGIGWFLARRGRLPEATPTAVMVGAAALFAIGLARAALVVDPPTMDGYREADGGPPMYVVLLDGYPRIDTLADLGIDNSAFVAALEDRGFDHYPDATSVHTNTHRTLLAMLTDETVNDEPGDLEERRSIRRRLIVPPGFVAVDPPMGFVVLGPGPHIDPGGATTFDGELLGLTVAGVAAPDVAWGVLRSGLDARLENALAIMASGRHQRLFVHLLSPHPPFLHDEDGETAGPRLCWPNCHLMPTIEHMGITREAWASGMAASLDVLNGRLLETIDAVLEAHPEAVIVLFGDHGARVSEDDRDEWHRPFLASRTPGHERLFAEAPRPDVIVRTLLATYGPASP